MKSQKFAKNGIGNYLPTVNTISEGTIIEGEIKSEADIRIDGKLKGVVNARAKVVIGNTGEIDGDIYCNSADVMGKISGTIEAKDILYLKSSARINGDIKTVKMVVESGALFNGNCTMGEKAQAQPVLGNERKITFAAKKEAVIQ